jgi:hypothetical protein
MFSDLSSLRQSMETWASHNLKQFLPLNYSLVLKSYFHSRLFLVEYTNLSPVNVYLPQGSFLGPLLYWLNTADLTNILESTTANFYDDTAVLSKDCRTAIASQKLEPNLNTNEGIRSYSSQHSAGFSAQQNDLLVNLMA